MSLNKICSDIKTLKIQGAIAIAKEGSKAFFDESLKIKAKTSVELLKELKKVKKQLINTRPTEPALRNALDYYFYNLNISSLQKMKIHLDLKFNEIMTHFSDARKKVIEYGVRKIKKGMVVYTHCHSSMVCDILVTAKKKGINFEVYNTETRPLYQGRKTATQLAKVGIKVTHFVDAAARHAIKKADIVFFGVDAITTTKIYNKIGTETFAMLAKEFDVPIYFVTDSWKFDIESIFGYDEIIEKRLEKEVWDKKPKNVKIYNYAFDQVDPQLSTGIISDLGVFTHSIFIGESKKNIKKANF